MDPSGFVCAISTFDAGAPKQTIADRTLLQDVKVDSVLNNDKSRVV